VSDGEYVFRDRTYSPIRNVAAVLNKLSFRPDVIVAHWISDFITVEQLQRLATTSGAPVVWYLLDMAPMTGGCHYAWDCRGYRDRCGSCPALYSQDANDLSRRSWEFKKRHILDMDLTVVAASQRLLDQATAASLFQGKRIEKILLGVDAEIFKPADRSLAKAKLGLPHDRTVVFFGSLSLKERRKGFSYIIDALRDLVHRQGIDRNRLLVVTAGQELDNAVMLEELLPHRHIGFLNGDRALAAVFQAADMFVCPSIEDSGPMMINESIMCGTPVVCFDMGVARDLIHTGKTGYRAALKDSGDLALGIRSIMDQTAAESQAMSGRCRETGLALCAPEVQVRSFLNLFESLTHRH
jgi:glycosyltransferase involved in cell wall biosynthesis